MFDLIKLLFDICLFKKAPQDLPCSVSLLKTIAIANLLTNFLLSSISINWLFAALKAIIGVLLISGFSWFSLSFSQKSARFYQTTAALLGTDTLIRVFALPVIATMSIGQGGLLVLLVMIALIIWYWVIAGHILRNALEQSVGFSLGLAFLYLLLLSQITALLIG
jgi:hypothetical protein